MKDRVCELICNVDDMTAEEIAFAMDALLAAGAKDVTATAAGMKKSRPGTVLTVMCSEDSRDEMVSLIFRHTTTIGIREVVSERYILDRREVTVPTPYGDVRRKDVSGYGVTRSKYEYDDLAEIASKQGVSLSEARRLVNEADSVPNAFQATEK